MQARLRAADDVGPQLDEGTMSAREACSWQGVAMSVLTSSVRACSQNRLRPSRLTGGGSGMAKSYTSRAMRRPVAWTACPRASQHAARGHDIRLP